MLSNWKGTGLNRGSRALVALAAAGALATGCGGDSGFSEDEIGETLNVRYEGADHLYESSEGTCIVTSFLTDSGAVEDAQDSGSIDEAVATNPDGTAGVVFGGTTSVDPNVCAEDATEDLEALTGE